MIPRRRRRADRGLVPDCRGARQPGLHAARLVGRELRRAPRARIGVLRPPGGRGVRARPGRPPLLHRLARRLRRAHAPRGPDGRHAVRGRGQARRGRQGAGLAQPPRRAVVQRGGEPPPQRRRERGGRGGAARPAGAARRVAPSEDGRRARGGAGRGVRRGHRPVPHPPRRRRPPRRPAGRADGEAVRRAPTLARRPARAARPGRRAARRRVPRALERSALARPRQPDFIPQGPAPPRRPHAGPAARPAARSPGSGHVRRPGAAHLPRDPAQDALRPARRAVGRPRLPQGVPPGAAG